MAGEDGNAGGLLQCATCKRWWAPDDIRLWAHKDWRNYPIECLTCFGKRTGQVY